MADSRCFIQFPHPGYEHQPDPSGHKAWNTYANAHARKFMQFAGQWTDERGQQHSGKMRAWGEWEAQSDLLQELDRPDSSELPRYLWLPYYTDQTYGYERLHNTDSFIFGERILYSNCKQAKRPNLRNLERGSVIAFGSKRDTAGCSTPSCRRRLIRLPGSRHAFCTRRPCARRIPARDRRPAGQKRCDRNAPALPRSHTQRPHGRHVQLLPRRPRRGQRRIRASQHRVPRSLFHADPRPGIQEESPPARNSERTLALHRRTSPRCGPGPGNPRINARASPVLISALGRQATSTKHGYRGTFKRWTSIARCHTPKCSAMSVGIIVGTASPLATETTTHQRQ